MKSLLLVIFLTLTPVIAHGSTYYVAKTGKDSNTCTQAQSASTPKLTIKAGLACLSGGDTLIIKAGTYTEGIPVNSIPSGINNSNHTIIRAATGETVTLNGVANNAGVMLIYSRSFITIDGIIFDAANVGGSHGIYIGRTNTTTATPSTFIRMQNCTVKNTPIHCGINAMNQKGISSNFSFINLDVYNNGNSASDFLPHGLYLSTRDSLVDGGSYHHNKSHGVHVFAQDYSDGTNNAIVRNVRAYGNGSVGIGLYSGSNLMAYNNVVYGNGLGGGIVARYGASDAKIYNNTIYNNTGSGIKLTGNPATVKNNIVYLNGVADITDQASPPSLISNNLTTNPSFDNAAASNFALLASSPAIDMGLTISEVTCDFLGTLRPKGAGYDVGAFEYTTPPPSNLRVVSGN